MDSQTFYWPPVARMVQPRPLQAAVTSLAQTSIADTTKLQAHSQHRGFGDQSIPVKKHIRIDDIIHKPKENMKNEYIRNGDESDDDEFPATAQLLLELKKAERENSINTSSYQPLNRTSRSGGKPISKPLLDPIYITDSDSEDISSELDESDKNGSSFDGKSRVVASLPIDQTRHTSSNSTSNSLRETIYIDSDSEDTASELDENDQNNLGFDDRSRKVASLNRDIGSKSTSEPCDLLNRHRYDISRKNNGEVDTTSLPPKCHKSDSFITSPVLSRSTTASPRENMKVDAIIDNRRPAKDPEQYVVDVFAKEEDVRDLPSNSQRSELTSYNPPAGTEAPEKSNTEATTQLRQPNLISPDVDETGSESSISVEDIGDTAYPSLDFSHLGKPITDPDNVWKPRKVTASRISRGEQFYRITWEPTWEYRSELGAAAAMIYEFEAKIQGQFVMSEIACEFKQQSTIGPLWKIRDIRGRREVEGKVQYFVDWEPTEEPESNLRQPNGSFPQQTNRENQGRKRGYSADRVPGSIIGLRMRKKQKKFATGQ